MRPSFVITILIIPLFTWDVSIVNMLSFEFRDLNCLLICSCIKIWNLFIRSIMTIKIIPNFFRTFIMKNWLTNINRNATTQHINGSKIFGHHLVSIIRKLILWFFNYDETFLNNRPKIEIFVLNIEFHYFLLPKIISTHKKRWTIRIKIITSHEIKVIRWLSLKIIVPALIPIEDSDHPSGAENRMITKT